MNGKALYISQVETLSSDGSVAFDTREGMVFRGKDGKTELLYDASTAQGDIMPIPWKLSADSSGEIYYADLGNRAIVRLSDFSMCRAADNTILYDFTVADDGLIYATDYHAIYSGMPSETLEKMDTAFRYGSEHILFRLMLLLAVAISAAVLLYLTVTLIRFVAAKPASGLTARISMLTISAAVVITVIVSIQSCSTLQLQENKWIDTTLNRFAFIMQKTISYEKANSEALEYIDNIVDYKTDSYRNMQKKLNLLCDASYYADSEQINNPIYYIIYKKSGNSVCSVMDFEDSMCAQHPMADYEGSEYQPVFEEGTVVSNQSDTAYGRCQHFLI